ncbi:GntR family transcriptional regulator [Amycolatopsis acidicola]|uniref:GntR family transcriptional regulator n=1 Tax=Amycolatopsis acidicola TaxID=2596893 RepID=A0A5N0VAQ2_9PSEU|nr:GntR family transcriptional regulator [Amycolatopsis acidicola]KAA9162664.1 GntR family transcriptional regulator [Amycolatopsis acidicola]
MSGERVGGSAQDVTYRWLKQHIGTLPRDAGSFLTESEVAVATGMSRTPVREALLRLETEGLLQIVPKKGAFVPPISDADVRAVLQARALLEDWSARRVVPTSPDFLTRLEELVAEQRTLVGDPMAFIVCDRAFHRAIVEQAGNPVLAEFYESLRDRQIRMGVRAVASSANRAEVVLSEHSAIVEALRSGDPDVAADAHITHLRSTMAALGVSGGEPEQRGSLW